MSKITPITPNQIANKQSTLIPDYVIEAFNILIAKNYAHIAEESIVNQDDVIDEICQLFLGDHESTESTRLAVRHKIFDNNWLNIEMIFENAGWVVSYYKPGYNEIGNARFTFKAK